MSRMRWVVWLSVALAVLGACRDNSTLTEPESVVAPAGSAAAALGTWTPKAPILDPLAGFAAAAAKNEAGQWQVYLIGGGDHEDDQTGFPGETYNVATDTWSFNNAIIRAADLNGIGAIGKRLYFTGGSGCCFDLRIFNTTWAYEPATNRMFQRANTPKATSYGVSGVIKGKLYVLPGFCSGAPADPGHCTEYKSLRELWRYDPFTDKWTTLKPPPHVHTFGGAAVIGDRLYVVGSWNQDAFLDVYDPATNTWQTRAPIPTPGERFYAAPLQSKLFVIVFSPSPGSAGIRKAYMYDPVRNTWTRKATPPGFGPIVKVMVGGQPRLFMPGIQSSYLYTP
jgi:N-acetylneuraminic acid mutarotase